MLWKSSLTFALLRALTAESMDMFMFRFIVALLVEIGGGSSGDLLLAATSKRTGMRSDYWWVSVLTKARMRLCVVSSDCSWYLEFMAMVDTLPPSSSSSSVAF